MTLGTIADGSTHGTTEDIGVGTTLGIITIIIADGMEHGIHTGDTIMAMVQDMVRTVQVMGKR